MVKKIKYKIANIELSKIVSLLGKILGIVVKEQEGTILYNKIEEIRSLSKASRGTKNKKKINDVINIDDITNTPISSIMFWAFSVLMYGIPETFKSILFSFSNDSINGINLEMAEKLENNYIVKKNIKKDEIINFNKLKKRWEIR